MRPGVGGVPAGEVRGEVRVPHQALGCTWMNSAESRFSSSRPCTVGRQRIPQTLRRSLIHVPEPVGIPQTRAFPTSAPLHSPGFVKARPCPRRLLGVIVRPDVRGRLWLGLYACRRATGLFANIPANIRADIGIGAESHRPAGFNARVHTDTYTRTRARDAPGSRLLKTGTTCRRDCACTVHSALPAHVRDGANASARARPREGPPQSAQ